MYTRNGKIVQKSITSRMHVSRIRDDCSFEHRLAFVTQTLQGKCIKCFNGEKNVSSEKKKGVALGTGRPCNQFFFSSSKAQSRSFTTSSLYRSCPPPSICELATAVLIMLSHATPRHHASYHLSLSCLYKRADCAPAPNSLCC